MTAVEVLDLSRESVWVVLKMALPVLLTSLAVGLLVSLFQALTQVQEMTLTFVPKLITVFICLIVCMPFMASSLNGLTMKIFDAIVMVHS